MSYDAVARAGRSSALAARVRSLERVDLALGFVFVLASIFYVWTASTSVPLSLHEGSGDRYNLMASALLHFHLWIAEAPAALMELADPYNPALNAPLLHGATDATSFNDDVLYNGHLYFVWGPAPALVLLVPLQLLGIEPSASVTVSFFGVVGLGFALATLRAILRQIGQTPVWMATLAGLGLAFASVIPYVVRTPSVSEDTLAGGYCFTMAGIWLAVSALVDRRVSLPRLVLMSLSFGFAAGSRPALGLTALALVPVYLGLRASRPRRGLLLSLALPVGICFLLLLAYNQARFNRPLEVGSDYQLAGFDTRTAPLGHLGYALPGAWLYASNLPQLRILFPFIVNIAPEVASPAGLASPEGTGGVLPMTPVVIFLLALPWIRLRRPVLLGKLVLPLLILAGAGIAMMLLDSYEFFAPTERYEVDFLTLFMLGGLTGWLALSNVVRGYRRRILQFGGALLVAWSCLAGIAFSLEGSGDYLAVRHPGTWRTLEDLTSPLSTAMAAISGGPVLASVSAQNLTVAPLTSRIELGSPSTEFTLGIGEAAEVVIVSPGTRRVSLAASSELLPGVIGVRIAGPTRTSHVYPLPRNGPTGNLPVQLHAGINRLTLSPAISPSRSAATAGQVLLMRGLSIVGS